MDIQSLEERFGKLPKWLYKYKDDPVLLLIYNERRLKFLSKLPVEEVIVKFAKSAHRRIRMKKMRHSSRPYVPRPRKVVPFENGQKFYCIIHLKNKKLLLGPFPSAQTALGERNRQVWRHIKKGDAADCEVYWRNKRLENQ